MSDLRGNRVAIVDYGLGNLFSVARACEHAGLHPVTTSDAHELSEVDAIILPGVGAFGSAMEALARLDLIAPLQDQSAAGTLLVGICLGMQLLMTESEEFGRHRGLGLIDGSVVRFREDVDAPRSRRLKVPHVGWNRIHRPAARRSEYWEGSLLHRVQEGEYMYFVHSYYATPADAGVTLSLSNYAGIEFCSSVTRGNIFGCQFHPERSGPHGLKLYDNLAHAIRNRRPLGISIRA